MSDQPETSRQRFLRNHDEDVALMRLAKVKAERDGRFDDAERIAGIVASWEHIGRVVAKKEEDSC